MRFLRYIILLLLILFIGVSFGQNPPTQASFTGGMGDGWSYSTLLPSENPFFSGGKGDGWSNDFTSALFNGLFLGGKGDGWSSDNFEEVMAFIFSGGQGDGWTNNEFKQLYAEIFRGGKGDGWASAFKPTEVLPLTLLSFDATKQGVEILLHWITTTEQNTSHFEVERSNGENSFILIGKVIAAGNSFTDNNYSIIDPEPKSGNNLYRLKMVDIDGSYTYSNVVLVKIVGDDMKIIAFPNPVRDVVNIKLSKAFVKNIPTHIYDARGRLVLSSTIPTGNSQYQFNLSHLAQGTYIIRLKLPNGEQRSIKVVR